MNIDIRESRLQNPIKYIMVSYLNALYSGQSNTC